MHKIPILILAFLLLTSNLIASSIFAKPSKTIAISATVLENITAFTDNNQITIQTNSNKETTIQKLTLAGKNYRTYSLTY